MKVATIGFFDGVHRGHRSLIHQVVEEARKRASSSLLVTFAQHPLCVLNPGASPLFLTTFEEKLEMLRDSGADEVRVLDFSESLAKMSAYDFMRDILKGECGVDVLVVGYDHSFGNGSDGRDYETYGKELGIEVIRAKKYGEVSASIVRNHLSCGEIEAANEGLGYNYFLEGKVVEGFQNGRKIDFPTANLQVDANKLLPCDGAYAVRVYVDGSSWQGMMNIGLQRFVENGKKTVETHIFDFDGDIYGKTMRVELVHYLRKEQKFDSLDLLRNQLEKDEREIRQLLNN